MLSGRMIVLIYYFEGTVFNTEAQAIVNTINCKGFMGAGLALEFKLRYPEMYKEYKLKSQRNEIKTGVVSYYETKDGKIIVNFPTKYDFRYPSRIKWIEQGLDDFVKTYKKIGIGSVAFPLLGTNKGGLNSETVKKIMVEKLAEIDIVVYICLDEKKEAEGIEKKMVESINSMPSDKLKELIKLSSKQVKNICNDRPYDRFREITQTQSIGEKTYSKLFRYFLEKFQDGDKREKFQKLPFG